ncbi:MAG TPA: TonB-dependent receptor [Chitinophagaceae bacterium]|nr:TonB-dependent receptor [Chitinophagaceae bacterium]
MKSVLFSFLSILFSVSLLAQNSSDFTGNIRDEKSNPVAGATVQLLNTNWAAVTNREGNFKISGVYPGNYRLQVTAVGYASETRPVQITGNAVETPISLTAAATRLDEVVVTAEKREELLQRLPLSVTALSSRQVRDYRLWNIRELTAIAPTFFSADPGDKRNVSSIRGITTTSYDPAIATYVDGVNQFSLDTYIPQLFDVERVEILRGPQGTLYGRNAMGGVVNIITKQPTNDLNGFVDLSYGNYNQQRYSAGLRAPLVKDKVFFGAAGLYERTNGFYTNDFTGEDFDKQNSVGGNFYLKFLPASNWSLTLNTKAIRNRNKGPFSLSYQNEFFTPFHVNQDARTELVDNVLNSSLSLNHTGKKVNFNAQTAYQSNYRYYKTPIDGDFSPIDGVTVINDYGKDWNHVKSWTGEFKFSSPASASGLQWTAGTYVFYQNAPNKQATRFGEDAALVDPSLTTKNFSLINTTTGKSKGVAAFGQLTYPLNDKWSVTGGLRYDYEQRKLNVLGEYQQDPNPLPQFPFQSDTSASADFKAFSPKVSIAYHPAEDQTLYINFSRGYRAGGLTPLSSDPSQPPLFAFKPENSNNYEIGYKSLLYNNRVRVNLAAFYTSINNAQVPTLILPDAITITRNAGELRSKGIELELAGNVIKGLELAYGFGYTNAEYKSLKLSQFGSEVNLEGRKQIFTPDVTSMLAAQYNYLVDGAHGVNLFLRGEWKYLGNHYFDLSNNIKQSAYHLLNARAGVATKCFEFALWGRNITDKAYISYAYDFGAVHLGDPGTYGASLLLRLN